MRLWLKRLNRTLNDNVTTPLHTFALAVAPNSNVASDAAGGACVAMPSTSKNIPSNNHVALAKNTYSSVGVTAPGEIMFQTKCPGGGILCIEDVNTYYQACCTYLQLLRERSDLLASVSSSLLTEQFLCPGRLILIRWPGSSESDLSQINRLPKAVLDRHIASEARPDWLIPAFLIDLNKTSVANRHEPKLNLLSWDAPNKSTRDFSDELAPRGTFDSNCYQELLDGEEEILRSGEEAWMTQIPYPPQMMPLFTPLTVEDGLARLIQLSNVPFSRVVRIFDLTLKNFASTQTSHLPFGTMLTTALEAALAANRNRVLALECGFRMTIRNSGNASGGFHGCVGSGYGCGKGSGALSDQNLAELANSALFHFASGLKAAGIVQKTEFPADNGLDELSSGHCADGKEQSILSDKSPLCILLRGIPIGAPPELAIHRVSKLKVGQILQYIYCII
ncbi:unnamed protein product [Protopolystoma xenopodis]|uniref:Uncharacterized protein n=1 Tax=Protopolystoma xenopodis TaxID=117903 RepID=A0A448WF49_9PLAT|nr:unnamed protein product [Protopolystoma xenopodis]